MPALSYGKNTAVYSDFDGTISRSDVLVKIFDEFGNKKVRQLEKDFVSGNISDREALLKKWEQIELTCQDFEDFVLSEIEIDPYFKKVVDEILAREIDFSIISGGFVNYIRLLLKYNNIKINFPVYGSRLEFSAGNVIPNFLHNIDSCHQSFGVCGTCKWKIIKKNINEEQKLIYIGDGLTDRCPAEEADIIIVRSNSLLEEYCTQNNLDFYSFNDFADVERLLFS